jgi:hypothetical protein
VSKILYLRQRYHFGAGRIADYLKRFQQVSIACSSEHRTSASTVWAGCRRIRSTSRTVSAGNGTRSRSQLREAFIGGRRPHLRDGLSAASPLIHYALRALLVLSIVRFGSKGGATSQNAVTSNDRLVGEFFAVKRGYIQEIQAVLFNLPNSEETGWPRDTGPDRGATH